MKVMRKFRVLTKKHVFRSLTILSLGIFMTAGLCLPAWAAGSVSIDNRQLKGVSPVFISGSTYVPMRVIFEAMGASITWDGATQSVTAIKGTTTVKITLNSTTAYINGKASPMSTPAKKVGASVMVPVRFVGESLGATVNYNSKTKAVSIMTGAASASGAPMDWETGWVNPLNSISDRQNAISGKFPNVTAADIAILDQITTDLDKLKENVPALKPINPEDGYAMLDYELQWTMAVKQAVQAVIDGDNGTANSMISQANGLREKEKALPEMLPSVYYSNR